MQKERKSGIKTAQKTSAERESSRKRFERLLFELAIFDFSLEDIDKSTRDLKKILIEYTGARGCTLMFLDSYNQLWKIGERTTYPFMLGEGVAGRAAKYRKEICAEEGVEGNIYKPLYKNKSGIILAIPLIDKNKVLGVLNFTYKSKEEMANSPINHEVKTFFVKKLRKIMGNIILFHKTEEERSELKNSKKIIKLLEGNLSHKRKMEEVTNKITDFVDTDKVTILVGSLRKISLVSVNTVAVKNRNSKSTIDLVPLYKKRVKKKIYSILDISEDFGFKLITKDGRGYTTIRPIYAGAEIIGFILLEDKTKNINNLSTREIGFIDQVAKNLAKYFNYQLSSKKIIEEKEQWRQLFQNDTDGVILLSKNKKIIEANPKAKDIFGSRKKSLTGKDFFSLFKILDPELKSPTLVSMDSVPNFKIVSERDLVKRVDIYFSSRKNINRKEYFIETKNGRYWILFSMNTTISKGHMDTFGVVQIRDITIRKELEQNKDEFISIASHELRTPLTAMKGFLSMIISKDYGELNEKQIKSLTRVSDSTGRMIDLVEALLDSSRIELERFCLEREPVNIMEATCEILRELKTKVEEKKIKIIMQGKKVSFSPDKETIEPGCNCKNCIIKSDIYVLADRSRLMQIIQNLLDNAIKYSFIGSKVEIYFTEGDKFATISIKDKGVGISEKDQKDLFKRFHRIHNPLSTQTYGTGLGLYITEKLVDAHGGKIEVKSKEGKGTTFVVKVPSAKQMSLNLVR